VLNGRKRWIGNASFADVTIVWARDAAGDVGAYLVEKGTSGFDASALITGKIGKRAVWQPDVTLVDVRVQAENKLRARARSATRAAF
jgi:glutaryl-CoA dehydrogenase